MTIGEATVKRIHNLCREQGITINRLAYRSGITQSTLNNIICGRNKSMTLSTLQKICEGLEIEIAVFFADPLFHELEQELE